MIVSDELVAKTWREAKATRKIVVGKIFMLLENGFCDMLWSWMILNLWEYWNYHVWHNDRISVNGYSCFEDKFWNVEVANFSSKRDPSGIVLSKCYCNTAIIVIGKVDEKPKQSRERAEFPRQTRNGVCLEPNRYQPWKCISNCELVLDCSRKLKMRNILEFDD